MKSKSFIEVDYEGTIPLCQKIELQPEQESDLNDYHAFLERKDVKLDIDKFGQIIILSADSIVAYKAVKQGKSVVLKMVGKERAMR